MKLETPSLTEIITEKEFLPLLQEVCCDFFKTFNAFALYSDTEILATRKCYSNLIRQAELLESFLDEYGARRNITWLPFTEVVASIRNLVIAAFFVKHLIDRYPSYRLNDTPELKSKFFEDSGITLDFLNKSIKQLFDQCIIFAKDNGLQVLDSAIDPGEFDEVEIFKQLPNNAERENISEDDERIIELFEKLSTVARTMEEIGIESTEDPDKLKSIVPKILGEKKARDLMSSVHNVQSEFDTYIKNTFIEQKHKDLKNFRGYISMPLHLLEVTNWLCHFYERHEDEIRQAEAKRVIAKLVNKSELLGKIVNYCYFYCLHYIREADTLSKEIVKSFVKTIQCEVPIPKPLGFHARPSTYISLIVRKYDADAFLIVDGEKFSARSVMSLLQAGGTIADKGYQTVIFSGDKRVVKDIEILAQHNYCEDQNIPNELNYLKSMRETA